MSVAIKLGLKSIEKHAVVRPSGESLIEEMNNKSEMIFDWACKNNSALVGKHYRDCITDFDHWKIGAHKPEPFFENIF